MVHPASANGGEGVTAPRWGEGGEVPVIPAISLGYNGITDKGACMLARALADGARPLPEQPNALACPVDGTVSQIGQIQSDLLMQAKGHQYTLNSLASTTGKGFEDGDFCTIYLAPSNYHRIHLPCDGTLVETRAIPGALFSVNGVTEAGIPGLFCRNERLVCRFETAHGPMLLVLVGALIVASKMEELVELRAAHGFLDLLPCDLLLCPILGTLPLHHRLRRRAEVLVLGRPAAQRRVYGPAPVEPLR